MHPNGTDPQGFRIEIGSLQRQSQWEAMGSWPLAEQFIWACLGCPIMLHHLSNNPIHATAGQSVGTQTVARIERATIEQKGG